MSGSISANTANFGSRIMALAIDLVLLETVHLLLLVLLLGKLAPLASLEPAAIASLLVLYLSLFFLSFLFLHITYFTLFHAWFGQTIGKMIMGIKVVMLDNEPVSLAVAFLRWCGYILSLAPLGAGFLWAAVDRDQCAWHDRLAQTLVISTEMT